VALLINGAGKWTNTDAFLLGNRVKVHSVEITHKQIVAETTAHVPRYPMCCPSLEVKKASSFRITVLFLLPGGERTRGKETPTVPRQQGKSTAKEKGLNKLRLFALSLLIFLSALAAGSQPAFADNRKEVQEIRGYLSSEEGVVYRIPRLKRGEKLSVYMEGVSGDLDPLVVLIKPGVALDSLRALTLKKVEQGLKPGQGPLEALSKILDENSLIWNDDFRGNYAAAFQYTIPADGSYRLLVRSTMTRETTGTYRLFVGVNAPEVLKGHARQNKSFVVLDRASEASAKGVVESRGTLSAEKYFRFYSLKDMSKGETLYLYVAATSGNLKPVVTLYDLGAKPLRIDNFSGEKSTTVFQYTFARKTRNCRIKISGKSGEGAVTAGGYRLILGVDEPTVLSGQGKTMGRDILKEPIPVKIGIKMQQITNVDQKFENFGVVATLIMEWQDPALSFDPEKSNESLKVYTGDSFSREMSHSGTLWPEFTIFNQQGNRWVQTRTVAVFPDGRATYLERFSTLLQAPDFDFRKFPFDSQRFFIRVDSLFPEWFFVFAPKAGYSETGRQLGEEEWLITKFSTNIEQANIAGRPVSRFNFLFTARRHLAYYIFRIFLPIFIILCVSWVVFFLKDYGKRIDVAAGNLLLFIAFNFTISNDLPRLGYLTFMDAIMISSFVVTALVLILSVFLKSWATEGREALALRIDKYVVRWLYPLAYIAAVAAVVLLFT
jgi:hypothetical protein